VSVVYCLLCAMLLCWCVVLAVGLSVSALVRSSQALMISQMAFASSAHILILMLMILLSSFCFLLCLLVVSACRNLFSRLPKGNTISSLETTGRNELRYTTSTTRFIGNNLQAGYGTGQ
jgi:hypothetical protein